MYNKYNNVTFSKEMLAKMYITHGSYFIANGVKYGQGTTLRMSQSFYKRHGIKKSPYKYTNEIFYEIVKRDGKTLWGFGKWYGAKKYYELNTETDIEAIMSPVYYYIPKELAKERLKNGTWIQYVSGIETLCLIAWMIVILVAKDWFTGWIFGFIVYGYSLYKRLSKP